MIRLSVTDLDKYRYWLDNDEVELEDFLRDLRGQREETTQMLAGKAFHQMLELADESEIYAQEVNGYRFVFAIEDELALPPIRELKGEYLIQTASGPVTLVGKVDALRGVTVHDYKLTERFDAERYVDSYQWRAYLLMFQARRFVYDVFVGKYNDDNSVWIHDYHRFPVEAYPNMEADVHRAVSGLAEIVVKHVPEKMAA